MNQESENKVHPPNLIRFSEIRNWIFDLDNTLYPEHSQLFSQISKNIRTFVSNLIDISEAEAEEVQSKYYRKYGTTLRGLMLEHNVEPDGFLEFVHDIDHSVISPDKNLATAIQKLPGRRFIMTNGTRKHAENVAKVLGITDHFEDIFGIVESEMIPKPHPKSYELFLEKNGIEVKSSSMFEDLARNLTIPHELGMLTVLIIPKGTREVFREDWEIEGEKGTHVDFVADNLGEFLSNIVQENF